MLFISLTMTVCSCHKNNIPHYTISAALKENFDYNVGSYWVYKDSINGEIDSFTVTSNNFNSENQNDAIVDVTNIWLKKYDNNSSDMEMWQIILMDSTFTVVFNNNKDIIESQLDLKLFTFPFRFEDLNNANYGTGKVDSIYQSYYLNVYKYSNVIMSNLYNALSYHPQIYNDYFYTSSTSGIVKVVFNHPQDSIYRVLELQNYFIVK